jgi:hypothetical protein
VNAHVGDAGEPLRELGVQVVEVAGTSGREKSPGGCSETALPLVFAR